MNDQIQILVVDDDPDIGIMLKMMLEYHGYRVFVADNEINAREKLGSNQVDLMLMDMLLSGTDGTDLCRQFKQDKKIAAIPIIMFSAHPNAKQACLAAGADQFIAKPFEMADMLERISECLAAKKREQD